MTGSECTIILHRCHIHEDHIKLSFNIINIFVFILDIFVTSWIYVNFNLSDVKKVKVRAKRRAENGLNNAGRQQWDFCGQPLHQGHGGLAGPKVRQDKDIPKNVFKMKVLQMLMIIMLDHSKKIWL